MKSVLRYYLINLVSLWATTEIIIGLNYSGGIITLAQGALVFAAINILLIPLVKILLLPLNLLTLGLFAWISNVLALYALTAVFTQFRLLPYNFPGFKYDGFFIPPVDFTPFWTAIIASFLIGVITHFMHWLAH